MSADHSRHPVVHLVGSIPLPDAETVFRTVSGAVGPHLTRLPDGETGIRKTWIRFLQDVLADNPAIEFASDVPPFKFVQWDGKVVREIPRLLTKEEIRDLSRIDSVKFSLAALLEYGLIAAAVWVSVTWWNPVLYVIAVIIVGSRINDFEIDNSDALLALRSAYRDYGIDFERQTPQEAARLLTELPAGVYSRRRLRQ